MDLAGLRVGNEVYAEDNDSYGLSTLTWRHVRVRGSRVDFDFPAKSGKQADTSITDPGVARVIGKLVAPRSRRLFTVDGRTVDSDAVNQRLVELTGAHFTAKDFRTWKGSSVAFAHLRAHLGVEATGPEATVLAAIDAAADALSNTRTVCRAHYVHPDVVDGFTSGELGRYLRGRRPRGPGRLSVDEQLMLGLLSRVLESRAGELAVG